MYRRTGNVGIKEIIEKYEGDTVENILKRKYIDEDMSILEISKDLNVSVGKIHQWLSEYQIIKQKNLWKN